MLLIVIPIKRKRRCIYGENSNPKLVCRCSRKAIVLRMSTKVNVRELTKTDLKSRLIFAPQWVKKMPAQAQRRWLVIKYPKNYTVGATFTGATAGHIKDRGVWSESDIVTFEVCLKIKTRKEQNKGITIDWDRVVPLVVEEYTGA